MTDNNHLTRKNSFHGRNSCSSSSPDSLISQVIVSSRHPHSSNVLRQSSIRSTSGSNSTNSRNRTITNDRSSIQMEPNLQALLIAESQAADMIARARTKRIELLQQANRESEAEINAFRKEREHQYQMKLHQATQLAQFQMKLDINQRYQLEQMEIIIKQKRTSLIEYIIHCVIDQISIQSHPNIKRMIF